MARLVLRAGGDVSASSGETISGCGAPATDWAAAPASTLPVPPVLLPTRLCYAFTSERVSVKRHREFGRAAFAAMARSIFLENRRPGWMEH